MSANRAGTNEREALVGKAIDAAKKEVIIDNEYATVWCLTEDKIIHHQFKQFTQGDNFRNALLAGAEAFEKYGCTKWLSDDRKIGVMDKEDTDWGETHFTPRVVRAGWKQWVNIMPDRVAGKMRIKNVIEHFKTFGIEVRVFDDPDEGYKWLAGIE